MEKILQALERRFGRYAIHNVAALLVAPKAAFFLFAMGQGNDEAVGGVIRQVMLIPKEVLEGEWWRIFTFVVTPPTFSILFFLIYLMLTFLFCNGLLQQWGAFRLNVYLAIGWLLTVVGSFVANTLLPGYALREGFAMVETTLFLGFATFYPDYIFRLFFILPVKVKWLAWLAAAGAVYSFGSGPWDHAAGYAHRVMILCAFSNYLLFFGPALIKRTHQKQQSSSRRRQFEEAMRRGHEERERAQREDEERAREQEREGSE